MDRDLRLGALAAAAAMVPGALLFVLGVPDGLAVIVTIGCGVGVVVALGRRWHRQATESEQRQTVHLRSTIGVAATAGGIPAYWTEHSITPETLTQIQQLIAALGLRSVLELGSGLSTVMIANAFRRAGGGKVLSLDDDARWAAQTTATLDREGLASFAEVRVAPLKDLTSGGRASSWYDVSTIPSDARFDLVIVDGPPAWKGDHLARLPALYELRKHLSDSGLLVLDDAARGGETEIARQWQRDFPDLHFRMVAVGRGLFVASVRASTLDLLP
jgi:predicted O-methyltransferase YrrM